LALARPLALRPPHAFCPSFRCHAGDLAICILNDCTAKRNKICGC
jgi:hypothetical protein